MYQQPEEGQEGRSLIESDLIAGAVAGDVDAFAELMRLHQGVALRVAYLVVRNHSEAEDVVQESFVKAHRALPRFRRDAPFRPWLLRIVRNEALNRVRRRGRQERLRLRVSSEVVSGGVAPSAESVVVADERRRRVLEAVEGLPRKHREVVAHRFLVGLSEAETAATLGVPVGTVKSRTARALRRLSFVLTDEEST